MIKTIIAAKSSNHVIGNNNQLPWHMPADLQHFRRLTLGHHVIMGRRTYESLPRPLVGRKLIVLSRNSAYHAQGCHTAPDLKAAFRIAEQAGETEVFIAGGSAIYQAAIAWVDKMYLTEIKTEIIGDTFFPAINMHEWREIQRSSHKPDDQNCYAYDFVELMRSR